MKILIVDDFLALRNIIRRQRFDIGFKNTDESGKYLLVRGIQRVRHAGKKNGHRSGLGAGGRTGNPARCR